MRRRCRAARPAGEVRVSGGRGRRSPRRPAPASAGRQTADAAFSPLPHEVLSMTRDAAFFPKPHEVLATPRKVWLGVAGLLMLGLAWLALAGGQSQAQLPPPHRVINAPILKHKFPLVTVHFGDGVRWVNRDTVPHTATSDPKQPFAFDT